jgi:hypothetical protein
MVTATLEGWGGGKGKKQTQTKNGENPVFRGSQCRIFHGESRNSAFPHCPPAVLVGGRRSSHHYPSAAPDSFPSSALPSRGPSTCFVVQAREGRFLALGAKDVKHQKMYKGANSKRSN